VPAPLIRARLARYLENLMQTRSTTSGVITGIAA
jgi:hypothetical protein